MSPPLDSSPACPPQPRVPVAAEQVLRLGGRGRTAVHDLRGAPVDALVYPAGAALVVAGVPGAGKSTALHRFFGARVEDERPRRTPEGALVLDSHQARNRWRHKLSWLPYPLWRPVVHVVHYAAIESALRDTAGPVVIHDCATFGWSRALIGRSARRHGRALHVLMLDVAPTDAMASQRARGRRVNGVSFRLHVRGWRQLIGAAAATAAASVVIVDRPTVNAIDRIVFGETADARHTDSAPVERDPRATRDSAGRAPA